MSTTTNTPDGPARRSVDPVHEFNVIQYKDHRESLLKAVAEERKMEQYSLLACAAVYSWLGGQSSLALRFVTVASLVPVVIASLSLVRSRALAKGIRTEADYLRQLERELYRGTCDEYAGPRGWETFLSNNNDYASRYELSESFFWIALVVLTAGAAVAFRHLHDGG